jgi:flagellin-like protein
MLNTMKARSWRLKTRKAITPILAIILTLMMAVALSSALFYWLSRIQNQQQGTAAQSQERLFETLATCLNVPTFDYNTLDNQSNLVVQNCGNTKVNFGDTRIDDVAIISATGINPCNLNINSSLCIGCPAAIEPGGVATLAFNWTAEPNCAGKIVKGVKHQISFFVDRKTTVSRSFVPDDVLKCNSGLGVTNFTALLVTNSNPNSACFNLTVTNFGNTQDVITISNTTNGTATCGSAAVRTVTCGLTGTVNKTIGLLGKSSTNIFVNHTATATVGSCAIEVSLTSSNGCNAKPATITAVQVRQ